MDFRDDPKPGYPPGAVNGPAYHFKSDYVITQCYSNSRDFVRSYASEIHNGNIVEIGVFGGATLLDLYEICKTNNNKIYGIDPFEKITIFNGRTSEETDVNIQNEAREAYKTNRERLLSIISKYNLDDIITVIDEPSGSAVSEFKDDSIDLLHIDGDHSTQGVYNDLVNYWPKMRKGTGVILGDDFGWKSVKDAVDKFCQEYKVTYTVGCSYYKYVINT